MKHALPLMLWSLVLLSFSLSLPTELFAQSAVKLRAGAATSNITPPLGELIVGGFTPLPADEVHDELHAKSIVLDDGKTKLVFVLCDNVGIPREVYDAARESATAPNRESSVRATMATQPR